MDPEPRDKGPRCHFCESDRGRSYWPCPNLACVEGRPFTERVWVMDHLGRRYRRKEYIGFTERYWYWEIHPDDASPPTEYPEKRPEGRSSCRRSTPRDPMRKERGYSVF